MARQRAGRGDERLVGSGRLAGPGLLDELDARFSSQLLDEERAATRVLGLCASGDSAAALVLARREFSARPRSIYTRRLEQSCASGALRQ